MSISRRLCILAPAKEKRTERVNSVADLIIVTKNRVKLFVTHTH